MIGSQKRVIIVDDDVDFRKALQLWFVKGGFEVILASNGQAAYELLRESKPVDLVLSDFMMPERNGLELVRLLKQDANLSKTPIVLMSNNTNPEFRRRAHELGATAFLLKPEGARAIAEESASVIVSARLDVSISRTPLAMTTPVQAVRPSFLAVSRLTAQTGGPPVPAKNALVSAEKPVENLLVTVPVSESAQSDLVRFVPWPKRLPS